MGGRYLVASPLEGPKGGYPLKKFKFFGKIFSQRIDRKSQKTSATLAWPFGCDKCSKKVRFNLTPSPPTTERVKFEENDVSLIFSIFASWLRYTLFLLFCQQGTIFEFIKWLYLSFWAKIEKTKGTLFSSHLKVWKNKEPLVFSILAEGLRYSHFLNF